MHEETSRMTQITGRGTQKKSADRLPEIQADPQVERELLVASHQPVHIHCDVTKVKKQQSRDSRLQDQLLSN